MKYLISLAISNNMILFLKTKKNTNLEIYSFWSEIYDNNLFNHNHYKSIIYWNFNINKNI